MINMDKYETVFNALGVAVGLSQIESILGIMLLAINVTAIVIRGIKQIIIKIKKKNFNIEDDLKEMHDGLQTIKNNIHNDKGSDE